MSQSTFKIIGHIINRRTSSSLSGLRVEVWDKDLLFDDLIRSTETDEQGRFHIEFTEAQFQGIFRERNPDLFFKVFHNGELIHSTEHSILWNVNQSEIGTEENPLIIAIDLPNIPEALVVKGYVRQEDGTPLAGVFVEAFDLDLRREHQLGTRKTTNAEGYYEITYNVTELRRPGKTRANLKIRVYEHGTQAIAESPVIFNGTTKQPVDLIVRGERFKIVSQYEKLWEQIRPILEDVPLTELSPAEIKNLVRETGLDRQKIETLIQAIKLSQATQIAPEVFYGFAQASLSLSLSLLLAQTPQRLRQTLETALKENLIPAEFEAHLDSAIQQLHRLPTAELVKSPVFLVKPEVYFGHLTDLSSLNPTESNYLITRLNQRLHQELLSSLGSISDSLNQLVKVAIQQIDYQPFRGANLATILKEQILPDLKDEESLIEEVTRLEADLSENNFQTVNELLYLDVPLKENPILAADIRRAKTLEYARLVNLDEAAAQRLADKNLYLDTIDDTQLTTLVEEGILTDSTQKKRLEDTINLGKLTDDNLPFIHRLNECGFHSVTDCIRLEQEDWESLMTEGQLSVPPGETVQTYAKTMLTSVEASYPSQVLLNRIDKKSTQVIHYLDSVNELLANHDRLIDGINSAPVHWTEVTRDRQPEMQSRLQALTAQANLYRYLEIPELINDKNLTLEQKKLAIGQRLQLINTFYQNNPQLDLRLHNFFNASDDLIAWQNIPDQERKMLRKQLMAYQRILTLGGSVSDRLTLMQKGYDSALAIVDQSEAEFTKNSGLAIGNARMLYAQAQDNALKAMLNQGAIQDIKQGGFSDLSVENLDPSLINDLREIDGYDDLFGTQNYCDCNACHSILSPSAYFVDLMTFIDRHVSQPIFVKQNRTHHSLHLRQRRNDLWSLNLTCENTYRLVPYLTIVNEVLEAYVSELILGDVFETLSENQLSERISFALPFNLSLEELSLYLSHFGLSLHGLYKTLRQGYQKIWRAKLNLSKQEFNLIVHSDPGHVAGRLGNLSLSNLDVQEFMRRSGITRQQLDDLLVIQCNSNLGEVHISKEAIDDDIQKFHEVLNHLTSNHLDFIYRFTRLWQKTPWTILELDLVLTALLEVPNTTVLNEAMVLTVAQLVDIQEQLQLTVEELCSLVAQLPVSQSFPHLPTKETDKRLFERLFDIPKLFASGDITTPFYFYLLNENNSDSHNTTIDPKTPLLLSGLGISETELGLLLSFLKEHLDFDANGNCQIDRRKISLLYRYARLAKALNISIDELISILKLRFGDLQAAITNSIQIQQLIEFTTWLTSSPFKLDDFRFILQGKQSDVVKHWIAPRKLKAIIEQIQQKLQKSDGTDKVEAVKGTLATSLNVSDKRLKLISDMGGINFDNAQIREALDAHFVDPESFDLERLQPILEWGKHIERIDWVFETLKFEEETIEFIAQHPLIFGIGDPRSLTFANLEDLAFYQKLITLGEEIEASVQEVLLNYRDNHAFCDTDIALLAEVWQQERSLVESLVRGLPDSSFPKIPIRAIAYLWECLELCQTLGVSGFSLQRLADDHDFVALTAARDIALGAFQSKYDEETVRQEKLEPYQDTISVKKRDILCHYIIARESDLNFNDLNDIYAVFLLDVEMSGCFRTSRLVCAISSLQLYVHRILVNLEESASDSLNILQEMEGLEEFKQEWEWRKNYRVWEANRKVFLYPENYLEPDLRDNKTPIFQELEDELLQEKITQESAEAAYRKYVSQFRELAHLIIAGSYFHEAANTYYFFGRTQSNPSQYYYRQWTECKVWTPWQKIELAIDAERISAIIHLGKLYLFWVNIHTTEKTTVKDGSSKSEGYESKIEFLYSFKDETGKWLSPQKLLYQIKHTNSNSIISNFCYPAIYNDQLYLIHFGHNKTQNLNLLSDINLVNLFKNELLGSAVKLNNISDSLVAAIGLLHSVREPAISGAFSPNRLYTYNEDDKIDVAKLDYRLLNEAFPVDIYDNESVIRKNYHSIAFFPKSTYDHPEMKAEMHVISSAGNYLLRLGDQHYLIQQITFEFQGLKLNIPISSISAFDTTRLSTSLADDLSEILFNQGLESFLSIDAQQTVEHPPEINFETSLFPPIENINHIDFQGAYGEYYRELYFHIPFLIANHLNASQKFEDAKWWYERIFDPTASESPSDHEPSGNRNWRFIEFREATLQKMKDMLSNEGAIDQYKVNPFNPHAIARLRMNAYQKTIVMKYIDNLLDWGDALFSQDSMESINEATMLYVLASDILGSRPLKVGACETFPEEDLTYNTIATERTTGSEFLIALENWAWVNGQQLPLSHPTNLVTPNLGSPNASASPNQPQPMATTLPPPAATSDQSLTLLHRQAPVLPYREAVQVGNWVQEQLGFWETKPLAKKYLPFLSLKQSLAFCVPANTELLAYWDRVEDRLFKIRNCMNISGVRRQLALFQPPINPMLLIRAKAAGLSLEDIIRRELSSPYRFSYLIEKAKQFAQTVQSFGSALLSALEKKDIEELTRLRSVHERDILQQTKTIKEKNIAETEFQYQSLVEAKTNVQNRIDYYNQLIEEGRNEWEVSQSVSSHLATRIHLTVRNLQIAAAISALIPNSGSPFAMTYGGTQIRGNFQDTAAWIQTMASIASAIAASDGLEATFQRRTQEWGHQRTLAQQELRQMEQQLLAAEIRQEIAQKDLEIHEQMIAHVDELDAFYKDKFTNLGLYNYLATTLNRLYREAYNVAHELALMAQKACQFERVDETTFDIVDNNWQFDRAGLLAGESLLLQLQRLEKDYLEANKRDYELTKHISLLQLDPVALLYLRTTGNCSFQLPEELFDMDCPGHYFRRIKSVALTIPCVTGPYTSVNCSLTLGKSSIRKNALCSNAYARTDREDDRFSDYDYCGSPQSIVTSSAQNDSGLFETNLRDERYLPFEGSGVISEWQLQLPNNPGKAEEICQFDYSTISDVILHLRYTARKGDKLLRDGAVNNIKTKIREASALGLARLFSLRHDFSSEWHQFVTGTGTEDFKATIKKSYFPFFAQGKTIKIDKIECFTIPNTGQNPKTLNLVDGFNGEDEFELLIPDVDRETQVFVIFHYSIE